jgi:clusterin-associated protein 1
LDLDITSRLKDIKEVKGLSNEIIEIGLNLLDLMDKEKTLKDSREKALDFLDSIAKSIDGKREQEEISKRLIDILQKQENTMEQLDSHIEQLKTKQESLSEEVKIKRAELERAEKRLESIQHIKPTQNTEANYFENELSFIYKAYVERIRNQDYLQNELERYHVLEEEHNKSRKKEIEEIQKKIIIYNNKLLHDENEELNAAYEDDEEECEGEMDNEAYKIYAKEAESKNNFRKRFGEEEEDGRNMMMNDGEDEEELEEIEKEEEDLVNMNENEEEEGDDSSVFYLI